MLIFILQCRLPLVMPFTDTYVISEIRKQAVTKCSSASKRRTNPAPASRCRSGPSIKRSVCYDTLHRILPDRNVHGSGFHVTRKTFSTNRLKSGVKPSLIADVLGHADMSTLTPYLSLDTERMSLCPLSLSELFITMEGGFR